jgi:hypothetical protein
VIKRKYYIVKRCINMGGLKNVKNPKEKKKFFIKGPNFKNWVV